MNAITLTNDNTSIERFQFIVTNGSSVGLQIGPLSMVGGNWQSGAQMFCQWTYVSGWANTFSTAEVASGATEIQVQSSVGLYPSLIFQIWDGVNTETVQVASTYDGSSLTIPLANPTSFRHGKGVNVSTLPATVKQAVIHLVVAMIKQRGQGGLVLDEIGEPVMTSSSNVTSGGDEAEAYDLLDSFQQIWGRY